MNEVLAQIQLKHNINGEQSWVVFLAESRYIPNLLKPLLLLLVHLIYCTIYSRLGAYNDAEKKVEKLINVYNKTNFNSKDKEVTKVAIVTGGNTGIGYETARMLVRAGFLVILACRSETKALEAIKRIEEDSKPVVDGKRGAVQFIKLDLSSLQSVHNFVENFLSLNLPLHFLINNAGVMYLPQFELTEDNHEAQFQVNHLSHFLLTNLLLPKLKETEGVTKVINLSSNAHYGAGRNFKDFVGMDDKVKYNRFIQYFQTKACNIMTTYKLHRLLKESNNYDNENGVVTYTCHPGLVNTELLRHGFGNSTFLNPVKSIVMKSPLQGALPTLRLVFLNEEQLLADAKNSNCVDATKFTKNGPYHHLYYSDELPTIPLSTTLSETNQDNLWEVSKSMVAKYIK